MKNSFELSNFVGSPSQTDWELPHAESPPPAAEPANPIRDQLDKILADSRFVRSERLCRFLRYTIEKHIAGQSREIKEFSIATEVYDKPSSYDPTVDSLVRVEASRLRSKLRDYYATTGSADPIWITYPTGTYAPLVEQRQVPVAAAVEAVLPQPSEGAKEEGPQPQPAAGSDATRRPAMAAVATAVASIMLVAAGGAWLALSHTASVSAAAKQESYGSAAGDPVTAIAILPFADFSGDPKTEAFAAGLTEDVTATLSGSGIWRVAARAQTPDLPGPSTDSLRTIGRKLRAGAVLEGSVRRERGKLRITAHLVGTADGFHLWSESFDRDIGEKQLATQAEISGLIAESLSKNRESILARSAGEPSIVQARESYRRGRDRLDREAFDHLSARGPEKDRKQRLDNLMAAIHDFEQAVAADPRYGAAYAALARAYESASAFDEGLIGRATEEAVKALQIDDRLSEAHFVLGYQKFMHSWDFAGALRELGRSIELNPRDASAIRLYADCAALMGDPDAGFAALRRANKLTATASSSPSQVLRVETGVLLFLTQRFSELSTHSSQMAKELPGLHLSHWLHGLSLEQQGKLVEAETEFGECLRLSPKDPRCTPALGYVQARLGKRDLAKRTIDGCREEGWCSPLGIALIHVGLGEQEEALQWMAKASGKRDGGFPYAKLDPRFSGLRRDPRFRAMLGKLNL
jgi:TolB-like protein